MISTFKKIFGTKHDRDIKKMRPYIEKINSLEAEMKKLSDDELKAKTTKFKKYIEEGKHFKNFYPKLSPQSERPVSESLECDLTTSKLWAGLHCSKVKLLK